jgi:HEAT repeat protein
MANFASAYDQGTVESVRYVCLWPDNRDFSAFNQDDLPGILIEIIYSEPENGDEYSIVVSSALNELGQLNAPEALPIFIDKIDKFPYECTSCLADYSDPASIETLTLYLSHENTGVRLEAAKSLSKIPECDDDDPLLMASIDNALEEISLRMEIEEDQSVLGALADATAHLEEMQSNLIDCNNAS